MLYLLTLVYADPSDLVFVGNSYTNFNNLPQQVETFLEAMPGWNTMTTTKLTGGGMTLADHAQRYVDGSSWTSTIDNPHGWTILQDQSQIPGFPNTSSYWTDSRDGLIQLAQASTAAGAKNMLFLTWGYRNGDQNHNPQRYSDYETMQNRITDGYLNYASETETATGTTVYIAPIGELYRYVHTEDFSTFESLYNSDGSHPSQLGTKFIALGYTAALSGRSIDSLSIDMETQQFNLFRDAIDTVVLGSEERFSYPWDWTSVPSDGILTDSYYRPRLRLRADHNGDLILQDARLWIESGRLQGNITLDDSSVLRIDGGTLAGSIEGSVTLNDGVLELEYIGGDLTQNAGSVLCIQEEISIDGNVILAFVDLHSDIDHSTLTTTGTLDLTALDIADELEWSNTTFELQIWRSEINEPSEEPSEPAEEPAEEPSEEPNEPAEEPSEEPNETDTDTPEEEEIAPKAGGCAAAGFLWVAILGLRRQSRE